MPLKKNRVSYRLLIPIFGVLIVISFISICVDILYINNALKDEYLSNWAVRYEALNSSLGPVLNAVDIALAQWMGEQFFNDPNVQSIEILNSIGGRIFEASREEVTNYSHFYKTDILSPIDNKSPIGRLIVTITPYQFSLAINKDLQLIAITIIILIISTTWLYYIIRKRAIIPVINLYKAINSYDYADIEKIQPTAQFGSYELNVLEAAFLKAMKDIKTHEHSKNSALFETALITESTDKALKAIDSGIFCTGVKDGVTVIHVGTHLPQEIEFLETVADKEFDEIRKILESKNIIFREQIKSVMSEGEGVMKGLVASIEVTLTNKQCWSVIFLNLDDGSNAIIYHNISEDTQLRQELLLAQKNETIGRLTGGVAHDFNNLLNVMQGNVELYLEKNPSKKTEDLLVNALSAARKGAKLTKSLLSFAREAKLDAEPLNINDIVQSTTHWAARIMPENIKVETVLQQGLWNAQADRSMTENALLNLLINARDAMENGGSLTIETCNVRIDKQYITERRETMEPGRYVMLAVSDTGTGISKDLKEKIFEPFFTTKEPGKGSGVGLSMIVGFMKQTGGTIQVYSEEGEGSTFKLLFPACSNGEVAGKRVHSIVIKPTSGVHILLVEDEPALRQVIKKQLEHSGYTVTEAVNGDEALRIYDQIDPVDVVLTDITMPGEINGPKLIRTLRATHENIRAVFMSGYAQEATVHGNGLKPSDIRLMKPIERMALVEAIETAVSGQDSQ